MLTTPPAQTIAEKRNFRPERRGICPTCYPSICEGLNLRERGTLLNSFAEFWRKSANSGTPSLYLDGHRRDETAQDGRRSGSCNTSTAGRTRPTGQAVASDLIVGRLGEMLEAQRTTVGLAKGTQGMGRPESLSVKKRKAVQRGGSPMDAYEPTPDPTLTPGQRLRRRGSSRTSASPTSACLPLARCRRRTAEHNLNFAQAVASHSAMRSTSWRLGWRCLGNPHHQFAPASPARLSPTLQPRPLPPGTTTRRRHDAGATLTSTSPWRLCAAVALTSACARCSRVLFHAGGATRVRAIHFAGPATCVAGISPAGGISPRLYPQRRGAGILLNFCSRPGWLPLCRWRAAKRRPGGHTPAAWLVRSRASTRQLVTVM